MHSLSPSTHSTPHFGRSNTAGSLHDSLYDDSSALPPLPIAAPQPRPSHGSFASLHAAAGLGLSHQPTFSVDDLEKTSSHLQVHSEDSSLKERQAYRSTTPVVNGTERFDSGSPSPERKRYDYPPNGAFESPSMAFNSYEKPASIRSVRTGTTTTRPSAGAPNLRSLGFSEMKQEKPAMSRRKKQFITIGAVVGIIAVIAIVVPVVYVVGKNNEKSAAAASSAAAAATSTGKTSGGTVFPGGSKNVSDGIDLSAYTAAGNPLNPLSAPSSMTVQSGNSGSSVSSYVNGTAATFTYVNDFGGYYYYDPTNPFAKGGKAQSWSPAIEEEWVWGRHIVRGVNLGGWLVPEPFIGKSGAQLVRSDLTLHSPRIIRASPQSHRRIHPYPGPPRQGRRRLPRIRHAPTLRDIHYRTRLCTDRTSGIQLYPDPYWLLGRRGARGGTIPHRRIMGLLCSRDRMGTKVWTSD